MAKESSRRQKRSPERRNTCLQLSKIQDSAIVAKLCYEPLNRRHHKWRCTCRCGSSAEVILHTSWIAVLKFSIGRAAEKLKNQQPSSTPNLLVDHPLDKTSAGASANSKTHTSGSATALETHPTRRGRSRRNKNQSKNSTAILKNLFEHKSVAPRHRWTMLSKQWPGKLHSWWRRRNRTSPVTRHAYPKPIYRPDERTQDPPPSCYRRSGERRAEEPMASPAIGSRNSFTCQIASPGRLGTKRWAVCFLTFF